MNIYEICKQKDLDELKYIIKSKIEINWNSGLIGACLSGYLKMVNLIILEGIKSNNKFDWNKCFLNACYGKNLKIIKLILLKIEKNEFSMNKFDVTFYKLCSKIVQSISSKTNNRDSLFEEICLEGCLELVNFLIIFKEIDNWNIGLRGACYGGYLEIVNLMISKGASDWNWGLRGACYGGHLEIVNLMISRIEENYSLEMKYTYWSQGLREACYKGHLEIVKLMISKIEQVLSIYYPQEINVWNWGFSVACASEIHLSTKDSKYIEIISLMIEKGANNINEYVSEQIGIKLLYHKKVINKLKSIKGISEYLDFISTEKRYFQLKNTFIIRDLNNFILNFLFLDNKL